MVVIHAATASRDYISGGGADGAVDRVVSLCLRRTVVNRGAGTHRVADPEARRDFDLAELITWAADTAGCTLTLPDRTDALLLACRNRSTIINPIDHDDPVAVGLATKGALLFGDGLGLSLGSRGRAIVHDLDAGLVVTTGMRRWVHAALIPGARGYR